MLAIVIGGYLLDSFWANSVTPRLAKIDKAADHFIWSLGMETAKDAVIKNIRESSGLNHPEFTHKWEVVPLTHDRYRMSSVECSLESWERICRTFTATVDTGVKKKIEEIRFH